MKRAVFIFCVFILSVSNLFPQQSDFPKLTGPYLEQKPPRMTPEIFAPEFISTEKFELNSIFSLDLKEFYFSILDTVTGRFTIMVTRNDLSSWSYPVIADFSGKYSDADPSFSPNGDKIFFLSDRPSNDEINKVNYDLWYVEKLNGHYGNPVKIGKHTLKCIAPNVFPEKAIETIAIVGKSKGKDFIVDKLVQCRFMYDEPNEYEILGEVDRRYTENNKDGVIVFKQKKL